MYRRIVLFSAVVGLCAAASSARADVIPMEQFDWGYRFAPDSHAYNFITTNNSIGLVSLPADNSNMDMTSNTGVATKISTPIISWSAATTQHPQTVANLPFAVNLSLFDRSSGISEYVSFGGVLNGNIWNNGSTLSPTFLSPLSQTINIDHHLYTVNFVGFKAPQGRGHPGSFQFDVTVRHNPEPSSMVLACIGLPVVGLVLRRRKRAAVVAA